MQLSALSTLQWNLIAGGLAIFLFGINLMGDALTNFAGPKLRGYVEKYTSNPIKGVLVGIVITGLIQSSSATTVIAISFVRAGVMSLEQAIGVILGANIGTTVTAVLIGFNLDYLSYFICLIGVGIFLFSKKRKGKYIGEILIGFGLLFIGLKMMGDSLSELKNIPGFEEIVTDLGKNPIIAVLVGAVLTALIQSSSAFIGIVQSLYASGAIGLNLSLGFLFGANIGTCITGILASLGGSLSAKRTSLFHVLFNVIVSTIFLLILVPYEGFISFVANKFSLNPMMTIAVGHFSFNFVGMILFVPLIKQVSIVLHKIIPGKDSIFSDVSDIDLEESLINTFPAAALDQAKTAIIKESKIALETIKASRNYLNSRDKNDLSTVNQAEALVNEMDTKIQKYILDISKSNLVSELEGDIHNYLQVQINVERVSDLAQNLGEYFDEINEAGEKYNEGALEDLNKIYDLVINNYVNSIEVFESEDMTLYQTLKEDESNLDLLEQNLRRSHYKRLTEGEKISTVASSVFVDIASTIERIGDHAFNIARITVDPVKVHDEYEKQIVTIK
ncbi:Na/Pi cotransporter family protein [Anaerococcus hydrogenalis]|uniref:Phosphate:sodium symporter n=1 Tax=Anaerococcus hydrogenalis TaxID=33029 RepID=A0A2N6UHB8_9FIRM|nr:Na/Pi cotransporter family protein [Anaerococcus hydrogenalis]MDK7695591.1 Na/Pi cotransporter family protein [Anaerococcus hydrogenalis]MDK7697350.1 Na/Pi cotransporter family protein [Anaerococcus hydrogenalis]MDK7708670.1 Na/Pi cotransporter family protein [Anaerococcus hydrogenalis]PMC80894.1 phosphate:sodium symporter [Anaerococcus hydrogenalis]